MEEKDIPTVKKLALEAALRYLQLVENRLIKNGPFHLGERFSMVDMVLAFWTAQLDWQGALDSLPAVKSHTGLVQARPHLTPKFTEMQAWASDYQQLQTQGRGVK